MLKHSNNCLTVFIAASVFYTLTRWLIFKGFNGTDDLHYAMLAARMIRGTYDPFQPGDIFSGRILLIATQAAIYKLAGINSVTTRAGSLIVVISSCYLTVFRLLPAKNMAGTLLATCLFYFNPVITYLTVGVTGDVYVMLAGIIICMLIKSWMVQAKSLRNSLLTGTRIAFIITLCLLYKETILVFIPFVCLVAYFYDKRNAHRLIISLITTSLFIIFLYACFYHYYTGDAFFKLSQIKNSSYVHHCNYDVLPFRYLLIRLTYGVWQEFAVQGFYPVIFGAFISIAAFFSRKNAAINQDLYPVFLLSLLAVCLYFPFSLKGYQPLCADARQYMLLLPLGVVVTASFITDHLKLENNKNIFVIIAASILAICIISTGNKWQWMIYLFLFLYAVQMSVIERSYLMLKYMALSGVVWLSILEHLFFKNSDWFSDMITLDKQINSRLYYFTDHDNMMHWQLLHHFDTGRYAFYNLEKRPFKIFKLYYQKMDTALFHPGWLLVNKAYTVRSPQFLHTIDSLQKARYFNQTSSEGDLTALLINTPNRLSYLKALIYNDGN